MHNGQIGQSTQLDSDRGNERHHQAAHDRPPNESDGQLHGRQGRHQEVDISGIELGLDQAGTRILEGVLKDRHHDQAGGQELDIVQPLEIAHQTPAIPKRQFEDRHEEQRRDNRGEYGLHPHFEEASDFALEQGPEPQTVHFAILADEAVGGGLISSCIGHPLYLGVLARVCEGQDSEKSRKFRCLNFVHSLMQLTTICRKPVERLRSMLCFVSLLIRYLGAERMTCTKSSQYIGADRS